MKVDFKAPFIEESLQQAREALLDFLIGLALDARFSWLLVCAADEILSNIIEHSGAVWMEFEVEWMAGGTVRMVFRDDGMPFDPTQRLAAADQRAGDGTHRGLGLVLLGSVGAGLEYRRTAAGFNQLDMIASPGGRKAREAVCP